MQQREPPGNGAASGFARDIRRPSLSGSNTARLTAVTQSLSGPDKKTRASRVEPRRIYVPCISNDTGDFLREKHLLTPKSQGTKKRKGENGMKEEMTETCKKLFTGDITLKKRELWLIGGLCLFAGVLYGIKKAPWTHGVIASHNGNASGNACALDTDEDCCCRK